LSEICPVGRETVSVNAALEGKLLPFIGDHLANVVVGDKLILLLPHGFVLVGWKLHLVVGFQFVFLGLIVLPRLGIQRLPHQPQLHTHLGVGQVGADWEHQRATFLSVEQKRVHNPFWDQRAVCVHLDFGLFAVCDHRVAFVELLWFYEIPAEHGVNVFD